MPENTPAWHNTIGYPQLGRENTPEYRGYVVRVQAAEHGYAEKWFTYAYDQEDQHTYWIGMSDSEDEGKAVLDRLLSEGWVCEVFRGAGKAHCTEPAVTVRHWWEEKEKKRGRLLLCSEHRHIMRGHEAMTIREFINTYNGLEQDAPILGHRKK